MVGRFLRPTPLDVMSLHTHKAKQDRVIALNTIPCVLSQTAAFLLNMILSPKILSALIITAVPFACSAERQCDAAGVCDGCPTSTCLSAADESDSVYRFGGTAQAYKNNSPVKPSICDNDKGPYRVATWPYRRASYKKVPQIFLSLSVLACGKSKKQSSCCCESWANKGSVTIEAWQTQPDGTYGSIQPGVDDGVCRAQQQSDKGSFEFETFPPGSYGSLGGLGPNGWDFIPYGVPVIHFMATSEGCAPTLVDLPIHFHPTTLESKSFRWNDWRGTAWTRQQSQESGYEIVSWEADPKRRTISIGLNLFLQVLPSNVSASDSLCESALYGLPSSFFREPISTCGTSLLDFFPL